MISSSDIMRGCETVPFACAAFLPRTALSQRIIADPARLIMICAPTGCGKSMALLSLATAYGGEAYWTSLAQLEHAPTDGHLLIDDATLPADHDSQAKLVKRLEARLATQRIVIATQKAPASGPLVVFLASRALQLGPQDVAFTASETALLFDRPTDMLEVQHWHHFVEGWPLGVAIGARDPEAALALMRRGGAHCSLPRALAAVFETLVRDTDVGLAMDLAAFGDFPLTLLPQLPQAAGKAAPKRADLDALLEDGLWLGDWAERSGWVRFMPAFARYLADRLQRRDPERAKTIRSYAVEWWARNQDLSREMRHGLALWSRDEAVHRLDQAGALQLSLSAGPDLDVDQPLDPASALTTPQAFLTLLYERIRHGASLEARLYFDKAYHLTEGFTAFATAQDQAAIDAWREIFLFIFRVADDLPPDPDWYAKLQLLRQGAVGRHPVLTMALCTLAVIISLDQGDRLLALRESEIGLQLHETIPAQRAALFVLLHRASALIASARLAEAKAAIEQASALVTQEGYADSYEHVTCQIHAGLCAFEEGQAERAYELLVPCAERVWRVHGWRRLWVELFQTLARLAYGCAGPDAAFDWLERGRAFALAKRQPNLQLALDLLEVELLMRGGDIRRARALLDPLLRPLSSPVLAPPKLCYQAQILEITLQEAEGRRQAALETLGQLDRAALNACDLRLHAKLELTALALERGLTPCDIWEWRYDALQRLIASYPALCADPDLQARLAKLKPEAAIAPAAALLSPRETQILALIVEGLSSKEIARELDISEGTVKSHRKKIYAKFGVNMRSQVISRAKALLGASGPQP